MPGDQKVITDIRRDVAAMLRQEDEILKIAKKVMEWWPKRVNADFNNLVQQLKKFRADYGDIKKRITAVEGKVYVKDSRMGGGYWKDEDMGYTREEKDELRNLITPLDELVGKVDLAVLEVDLGHINETRVARIARKAAEYYYAGDPLSRIRGGPDDKPKRGWFGKRS
jgi:hypothetical protein